MKELLCKTCFPYVMEEDRKRRLWEMEDNPLLKSNLYIEFKGMVNDNNRKQGKWSHFTYDQQLLFEGHYLDGLKTGYWENWEYDSKGVYYLSSKGNYTKGRMYGEWFYYYVNGKIKGHKYHFFDEHYIIESYVDLMNLNKITIKAGRRSCSKTLNEWDRYFQPTSDAKRSLRVFPNNKELASSYAQARLYYLNLDGFLDEISRR